MHRINNKISALTASSNMLQNVSGLFGSERSHRNVNVMCPSVCASVTPKRTPKEPQKNLKRTSREPQKNNLSNWKELLKNLMINLKIIPFEAKALVVLVPICVQLKISTIFWWANTYYFLRVQNIFCFSFFFWELSTFKN